MKHLQMCAQIFRTKKNKQTQTQKSLKKKKMQMNFLCANVRCLLPTAQWFPRGYILPLAAAGLSEQRDVHDTVARMIKSDHSGLQVHE